MKGNVSKKKGLLSEITNEHLDYISDKLYGKVGFTREEIEKIKEETAQKYNDLANVVAGKEDTSNKSTTIIDNADDEKYPTTKVVKDYVEKKINTVFKYCGTVEYASELPTYNVNENIGHVYNILNETDFDDNIAELLPSRSVAWTGKLSLINGSYYLTIKDENGQDITQSLPGGQGMHLTHFAPYPAWDFPYTAINFVLNTKTDSGWLISISEGLVDLIEDMDNIGITQYTSDLVKPKAGDNAVWNGYCWDILSGTVDLSGYATKNHVSEAIQSAILDSWGVGV